MTRISGGFIPAVVGGIVVAACLLPTRSVSAQRQLTATIDLTIDGNTNDLTRVGYVAVSRSGVIAITQPRDNLVRFFRQDGNPLGTFGRKGEGPGEFRSMRGAMTWKADTLMLGEMSERRITFVSSDRKLVRTTRVALDRLGDGGRYPMPSLGGSNFGAVLPDGSYLVWAQPREDAVLPAWLKLTEKGMILTAGTW